eukprot:jgi/Psemu1/28270/gm1.28270_g
MIGVTREIITRRSALFLLILGIFVIEKAYKASGNHLRNTRNQESSSVGDGSGKSVTDEADASGTRTHNRVLGKGSNRRQTLAVNEIGNESHHATFQANDMQEFVESPVDKKHSPTEHMGTSIDSAAKTPEGNSTTFASRYYKYSGAQYYFVARPYPEVPNDQIPPNPSTAVPTLTPTRGVTLSPEPRATLSPEPQITNIPVTQAPSPTTSPTTSPTISPTISPNISPTRPPTFNPTAFIPFTNAPSTRNPVTQAPQISTTNDPNIEVPISDIVLSYQENIAFCSGPPTGIGCASEDPNEQLSGNPNDLINCYNAEEFGVESPFQVNAVRFWIGDSSPPPPDMLVNIFSGSKELGPTNDGILLYSQQIFGYKTGENIVTLTRDLMLFQLSFCVGVTSRSPDGGLRIQTDDEGETDGGSYLRSPECGINVFTSLIDAGLPQDFCIEVLVTNTGMS